MIYFDNAATTKPSKNALKYAEKFNEEAFFNPSALYRGGLDAKKEINAAKESILKNLGSKAHEVIFTSCGTESDNTAVFGAVKRGTFVTDKGEHAAIYKSFLEQKNRGNTVEFIDLEKDGRVNLNKLYAYLENNNADFVSVMHVNNETGAINDVAEIAKRVKAINPKTIFHSDGVQAYGKIPFTITGDIDFYSISAHKINGLKGVGALIKKKGVNLSPYLIGGGQENGYRSGTENVFGIKVFEYASNEHYASIKETYDRCEILKKKIIDGLNKDLFFIVSGENSSPYVLSVSAIGLRGEVLMHSLETKGIYVGNGSACSAKNRYSRIIEACGYKDKILDGVLRISLSRDSTEEEVDILIKELNASATKLKGIMK